MLVDLQIEIILQINGSLFISGLTVLEKNNLYSTSLSNLFNSTSDNDNVLITFGTGLSTLYNSDQLIKMH